MLTDSHPLGAILYRKWHMYDMMWEGDKQLENFTVCGAPFGGPVAMISNLKKENGSLDADKIFIYTSAGDLLSKIEWDNENIVGMGWTDHEQLMTLTDTGKYYMK